MTAQLQLADLFFHIQGIVVKVSFIGFPKNDGYTVIVYTHDNQAWHSEVKEMSIMTAVDAIERCFTHFRISL